MLFTKAIDCPHIFHQVNFKVPTFGPTFNRPLHESIYSSNVYYLTLYFVFIMHHLMKSYNRVDDFCFTCKSVYPQQFVNELFILAKYFK